MRRIFVAIALFFTCGTGAEADFVPGFTDTSYVCDWNSDTQEIVNCRISCDQYVALAVQSAEYANANSCGFGGPRWSTDPNVHRAACQGDSISVADNPQAVAFLKEEERQRHYDELRCNLCRAEMPSAMKDVAAAKAMHCTFLDKSPIWPSSADGQFNVCMSSQWWAALWVLMHTDNAKSRAADLAVCRRQNQLVTGVSQGKSLSQTRREDRAKMLEGSVRKVLPCPPELGPNCNKPQERAISNPGLLEADGGFTRQGPSVTGTPIAPRSPSYLSR
ncbi:MAG: hypothetical protein ACXWKP_18775 [Bradyrhizobium sp.]